MITKKNTFSGAAFDYENKAKTCAACGDYRVENDQLQAVSINGQYTKDAKTYNFSASRDAEGNVNIAGVQAAILPDVATEVSACIAEVESIAVPAAENQD